MNASLWRGLVGAVCATSLLSDPAHATRIRPGTLSLGATFDYSSLTGGSSLAQDFRSGPGFQVRVRYRMAGGWTVGSSFGQETFAHSASVDSVDRMRVISAGVELGRYFGNHARPMYVTLGAGVWNPTVFRADEDVYEANKADRVYLSGTIGTEVFVRRSVALDFSARGRLHFGGDKSYPAPMDAPDSQSRMDREFGVQAGVHFYVLD